MLDVSRRSFLVGSAAAGFTLGFHVPFEGEA
ncbi:twin-arginine translocation signal domain-containing protein, partial [Stenotrophomonas maltophilia]